MNTVTHRLSLQAWLALLGLGLAFWWLISASHVLVEMGWVLMGAWLLSLAIRPLTVRLASRHIPRTLTVLAVYAALLAILILLGNLLLPLFRAEVSQVRQNGPQLWQQVQTQLNRTPLAQWLPGASTLTQDFTQRLDSVAATALGTVTGVGGLLLDLLVLFILAYFFTVDATWGKPLILNWTPPAHREHVGEMIDRITHRLSRWVWAQVGVGLYYATAVGLGLTLLHVPFAFTIAVVGGVLEFIPYLGGVIGGALAIISALTVSPALAVWAFLVCAVVSSAEGHLVAPALYGRVIGLRSAVVLIALVLGVKAGGIVGVFFAVPVAVIVTAVLQDLQGTLIGQTTLPEEQTQG